MNEKERVERAISFHPVDRIPHQLDFTIPARKKMTEYLGDSHFEDTLGNHLVFLKVLPDDAYFQVKPGFVRDEWGVVWNRTVDPDIGNPIPVLSQPSLRGFRFPDPGEPRRFEKIPVFMEKNVNKMKLQRQTLTLFERAWSLRGMENLLSDMVMNPEFVHDLFTGITEYHLAVLDKSLDMGFDGVMFGDDWAWQRGLIMSPKMWRNFIKPYFARLFADVKKKKKKIFFHCCGKVEELFPDLVEIGLDVFNPFQPEVMDVFQIKKEYQGKLAFWGGISIQELLPFATPGEVKREVKKMLRVLGEGGGYIAAPSHALPKDIPCENILAMLEAIREQELSPVF
ncbi:MAG: hypothetical protein NTX88_11315 [Candidatus Atribacteria bacterium]|nr:hypothetical protein [Candidatus Atribacteria bacterium]